MKDYNFKKNILKSTKNIQTSAIIYGYLLQISCSVNKIYILKDYILELKNGEKEVHLIDDKEQYMLGFYGSKVSDISYVKAILSNIFPN